jgi:hypothetical protein
MLSTRAWLSDYGFDVGQNLRRLLSLEDLTAT